MNYYPFHLGDYAAHTQHLEPMEDLAYRRLLDLYYLREGPLPADIQTTAKLVRMRPMAADVECVLKEFFSLTEAGWMHVRCDEEIERMLDKQSASEERETHEKERMRRHRERRADLFEALREKNVVPAWDVPMKELQRLHDIHCNAPATHLQREQVVTCNAPATAIPTPTPTPTPEESKTKPGAAKAARFDPLAIDIGSVPVEAWNQWIAYRRSRKLTCAEATITAQAENLNTWLQSGHQPAVVIAKSIENGWQGLFEPKEGGAGPPRPQFISHADQSKLAAARTIFGTEIEAISGKPSGNIIDITPTARTVGRQDLQGNAGQLRFSVPEPMEDRANAG